jgi:phosphoribosylamine---glycine ligase
MSEPIHILLLGSGGREHALAWKIKESHRCGNLFIAPGNAGTHAYGTNVTIAATDFEKLAAFALEQRISMIVVGPEDPLVAGVVDYFNARPDTAHIKIVGPAANGAQLEGSKAFAKAFMHDLDIPTAGCQVFNATQITEATTFINSTHGPYVLKADGLAAGKGVVIVNDPEEAIVELTDMLGGRFGTAGHKVVIEQFLKGLEFSVFVLTDGQNYKILPVAKDYKRVGAGDTGLNTGGMGSVSHPPFVSAEMMQKVEDRIVKPTLRGIKEQNLGYKGIIFVGCIEVNGEPFVIEYNCRFGDPETQSVMSRLQNDVVALFESLFDGSLAQQTMHHDTRQAATVVVCAAGYPNDYRKGDAIALPQTPAGTRIFLAGAQYKSGQMVTAGGRVLAVTSLADRFEDALAASLKTAEQVTFEGRFYREDIGFDLV